MTKRCAPLSDRPSRATAWLLALLCLWMGTGGVLHHTEDLPASGVASPLAAPPPAAWGHATPAAPAADGCAACQWTQGVQSGPPLLNHVVLAFSFAAPPDRHAPDRLLSRLPLRRSPRGPPLSFS